MKQNEERLRKIAIARYLKGESPKSIYTSLNRSKQWLFKWAKRSKSGDHQWYVGHSRRPHYHPRTTSTKIEQAILDTRDKLDKENFFCGAQNILWQLREEGWQQLPSVPTVNRILKNNNRVKRRRGPYQPKGKPYPQFPATLPNQLHQADMLGPRYLKGPIRFYSFNIVDVATKRGAARPVFSRRLQTTTKILWDIWFSLGIPDFLQFDNELVFRGSNRYPRALGGLIRLCLLVDVEPIFIPPSEPWRNSIVENFNLQLQDKWIRKTTIRTWEELQAGALQFEQKHNSLYRYTKLKGKTPLQALRSFERTLRFPESNEPPDKLQRPRKGKVHLVRFIRSDRRLDVFGEAFLVDPDLTYEYVKATIDVKEQKLKVYRDSELVQVFDYTFK
jgi:putative transposase